MNAPARPAPVTVDAAPDEAGLDGGQLRRLQALTHHYVDSGRLPGTVTVVARRGRVAMADAYGLRDVARGEPMTLDTIFRIYSMTKPVVSVALLRLHEQGAFLLEDPVSRYLPEFGEPRVLDDPATGHTHAAARPITIADLLRHTSGLVGNTGSSPVSRLYQEQGLADPDGALALDESVRRLAALPLAADPGQRWIYGVSTDVVGRLCEVLSGQPLDEYLASAVLAPLGMPDTGFQVPLEQAGRLAACYTPADGPGVGLRLLDDPASSPYVTGRRYLSGSQGLVSTASDYLRFAWMLNRRGQLDEARVLGPRTVELMMLNHLPGGVDINAIAGTGGDKGHTRTPGHGFGLGGAVLTDQARAAIGATQGEFSWGGLASTAFFVSPGDDLAVLFLTQLRPSAAYRRVRRELRAIVYAALSD
jgi:CubicO group peptidase (beta-lactamase class C family)